jgi:hypothetical protein
MSETQALPKQFAGLSQWMAFALPTTKERLRKRTQSTMPQLQAFYDAMAPQMDAIMTYLMDFPAEEDKLAPQELNLVRLAKAFMEVALAVELFKAPDEPHVWSFEDMVLEDR